MFSLLLFLSYVFFSPFYTPNVCIAHPRSSESGDASKHIPETAEKGDNERTVPLQLGSPRGRSE